jgi:hypothetical protein
MEGGRGGIEIFHFNRNVCVFLLLINHVHFRNTYMFLKHACIIFISIFLGTCTCYYTRVIRNMCVFLGTCLHGFLSGYLRFFKPIISGTCV